MNELREFLRLRRKGITPQEAGLPDMPGRRLRGLRREDVAELAGVSVGWYARLELGRIESIAPRTLAAIARALRLDSHETGYLFALTRTPLPHFEEDDGTGVATHLRLLVERFTAGSAILIGSRCDVLLSNDISQSGGMVTGAGSGFERNAAWQLFTKPKLRRRIIDWDTVARLLAAYLREDYAYHVDDPEYEELLAALRTESAIFARYWDERVVSLPAETRLRLRLEDGGIIEVMHTRALIESTGLRLWFMVPLDPADLPRFRS